MKIRYGSLLQRMTYFNNLPCTLIDEHSRQNCNRMNSFFFGIKKKVGKADVSVSHVKFRMTDKKICNVR